MTSQTTDQNYGPPPPITKLTVEQDFKLRQLEVFLGKDGTRKEDIITILLALQRQNYVMANSIVNLVELWPQPEKLQFILPKVGIVETTNEKDIPN
jgi:hypothetical protein